MWSQPADEALALYEHLCEFPSADVLLAQFFMGEEFEKRLKARQREHTGGNTYEDHRDRVTDAGALGIAAQPITPEIQAVLDFIASGPGSSPAN